MLSPCVVCSLSTTQMCSSYLLEQVLLHVPGRLVTGLVARRSHLSTGGDGSDRGLGMVSQGQVCRIVWIHVVVLLLLLLLLLL